MNRALPTFSVRRPVATAMLFLGIALVGAVSLTRLPVNLLPDVSFPTLVVSTDYPDAAPAEVERYVSVPIEERLAQVGGVREVTSRSRQGHSLVRLTFAWGTDMQFAALDVRERLDGLRRSLPESSGRPTILRTDPSEDPVLTLALTGADPVRLRDIGEAVVKRRMEQLEGVSLAAVVGGPRPEVHVTVEPDRLAAHGLSVREVRQALDEANYSAPGGRIHRRRYHYTLRTLGEFRDVADIRKVTIRAGSGGGGDAAGDDGGGSGGAVQVGDVATVESGSVERRALTRYNGEPAVGLEVFAAAGANTIRVDERVGEVLGQLRAEYPELDLRVAHSQAGFIRDAIRGVLQALAAGGLLAFGVLFLFLRDPRYPLAVGLAIPVSVLAALALFDLTGVSVNVMSLGGLALAVGMLVDNSIVVLENIFRHREEGRPAGEAAVEGTAEVGAAITASTLTTIAVFGPVLYVEGVAGTLFEELSLSVAFALLASLLAALALLPGLTVRVPGSTDPAASSRHAPAAADDGEEREGDGGARGPLEAFRRAFDRFAGWYERALAWSLDHRPAVIGGAALSLAAAAWVGASLPRSVMPSVDERALRVEVELPVGTPLAETADAAARAEEAALGLPGGPTVFTRVGRPPAVRGAREEVAGEHVALLRADLPPDAPSSVRAARMIRSRTGAAGLPSSAITARPARTTSLGRAVSRTDADLVVEVRGEDVDSLHAAAASVRDRLREIGGLTDARVEGTADQPTVTVNVDRGAAARHGVAVERVASALRNFAAGARTERPLSRFADRVPIRVQLPPEQRRSLEALLDLRIRDVPLRRLVRVERGRGPVEIRREGQTRVVRVLAGVDGGLASAVERVREATGGLELPGETRLRVAGANERMRESFGSLLQAFGLALVLVYLILAAQFESLRHPFVILGAVPLAAVGALGALWVAGAGLNVISGIGIVVLIGIVVNDAIVKVDFINQRRREGVALRAAIVEAGRLRLRPIVMTTVTTVFGLLPLALGWGAGADLRAPLAVAVVGGLLSATVLTLLVVPVLYGAVARRDGAAG
mgnify:CR=1 FL=1